MDGKQIRYFLKVCEEKNITHAAKKLYITQQAMSISMKHLEEELDAELFKKEKRRIELTPSGLVTQKYFEQIVATENSLANALALLKNKSEEKITLRIAVALGVISSLPADFFENFEKRNPGVEIKLEENTDYHVEDAVMEDRYEIGLGIGPVDHPALFSRTVVVDRLCLLVPEDHPLAVFSRIRFEDLKDQSFLILTRDFKVRKWFHAHCRAAGFEPEIALETMELILIHYFSRQNKGVGISVDFVAKYVQGTKAIPFTAPDSDWSVCMIGKKNKAYSDAALAFIDYVKEQPVFSPGNTEERAPFPDDI